MSVLEQRKQKLLQFKGAMAAVITPYDKNGKVDVSQIGAYVKYLVDIGVNGVYIIGTTGEGYNLTNAERVELARAWRQALDKHRAPLLAVFNVSSNCWRESLDLSREVERLGFDAIAVLPPIYYKPNTVEDWVDALRPVAKAAPNTPLLYYHIPSMAGTFNFDIVDAIGEGIRQIPQLAAMKFTDDNVIRFLEIQKRHKNVFKIFIGFDQVLLTAMAAVDCEAAICALFSFPSVVESYHKIVESVKKSDLVSARTEQNKIIDECNCHKTSGNFFLSIKTAFNRSVKHLGLDFGHPRPPICNHYEF